MKSKIAAFILAFAVLFHASTAKLFRLKVLSKKPVCEVEDRFLSIAMGIGKAERDFKIVDFSSEKLKTLLTALKPAYFRLGGSAANFLFFKVGSTKPAEPPHFPDEGPIENGGSTNAATTQAPPSTPNILAGQNGQNTQPTTVPQHQSTPFTPSVPGNPTMGPNTSPTSATGAPTVQTTSMPQNNGNSDPNQPNNPTQPGVGQDNQINTLPLPPNKNQSPYHEQETSVGNDVESEDTNEVDDNSLRKDELSSGSGNYDDDDENRNKREKRYVVKRGKILDPFWLMSDDFDKLFKFVSDAGLDLIFNLGDFVRYSNGTWNATNALEMLNHVAARQFKVGWQLGNEPNSYKKYGEKRVITGQQDGEDAMALRRILRSNSKFGTLLVGPDVTRPKGKGSSEKFLTDYLSTNASSEVSAVSWHQYYVDGRTTTKEEMTDPKTLDLLKDQILRINKIMADTKTNKPVWMTETGSAWGGGAPGISDTFAASFAYLDKLCLAGVFCHSVVMRQSILSGNYAMLDNDYTPRPDYWLALLHKGLVGKKVLLVEGDTSSVRAYCHCTKVTAKYPKGALTIMVMNLRKRPARISFEGDLQSKPIDQFLVTSSDGSLTTKQVLLNGKKLQLSADNAIPDLPASRVKQPMKMPSYSYAFYVVPGANNEFCV